MRANKHCLKWNKHYFSAKKTRPCRVTRCYSISIDEQIASSVAHQITAFAIVYEYVFTRERETDRQTETGTGTGTGTETQTQTQTQRDRERERFAGGKRVGSLGGKTIDRHLPPVRTL